MTEPDPHDAWPDALDTEILAGLNRLHTRLDPPPPGMAEQMMLAMALAGLDAELATVGGQELAGSGARAAEHISTITFDAASLTIMMSIVEVAGDRVRVDGWLAPPAALRVELRLPRSRGRSSFETTADDAGRFVFPAVPRALVWLVVHRDGSTVVTPTFAL